MSAIKLSTDPRGVATLLMDRPDKHNAFDDRIIADMLAALDRVAADDQVRVLVLAANGRSFSAGADLNWMRRMAEMDYDGNLADARRLAALMATLNSMAVPVIARVNGAAFGGAVGLVACCDLAFAADTAAFSLSEVKVGLVPATVGPYVIRAMGERAARRYFMTGERFDAHRARELGLVSEVVAADELDTAVEDCIENLLANGPGAVAAAKQLVAELAGQPLSEALSERTSEIIAQIRVSGEGQQGLQAFLAKRTPPWRRQ